MFQENLKLKQKIWEKLLKLQKKIIMRENLYLSQEMLQIDLCL